MSFQIRTDIIYSRIFIENSKNPVESDLIPFWFFEWFDFVPIFLVDGIFVYIRKSLFRFFPIVRVLIPTISNKCKFLQTAKHVLRGDFGSDNDLDFFCVCAQVRASFSF